MLAGGGGAEFQLPVGPEMRVNNGHSNCCNGTFNNQELKILK